MHNVSGLDTKTHTEGVPDHTGRRQRALHDLHPSGLNSPDRPCSSSFGGSAADKLRSFYGARDSGFVGPMTPSELIQFPVNNSLDFCIFLSTIIFI